jgi:hypothetical protein
VRDAQGGTDALGWKKALDTAVTRHLAIVDGQVTTPLDAATSPSSSDVVRGRRALARPRVCALILRLRLHARTPAARQDL